ncbi:MAG TPA: hypothetical protein VI935_11620 [Thermodesulfobacteriota bacterium]|nr:hypothetical protein [Thermodesulfobacteriota bacterium]
MRLARVAILPLVLALNNCSGQSEGAGYWFHFIFVVIPLIIIGFFIFIKSEKVIDSLFTIEGQLKKLTNKVENLEEKLKKLTEKEQ